MRVLLIGKYPPIQGGVSTQTFWLARGLAELGHDVHVITNSGAVEYGFRMLIADDDQALLTQSNGFGAVRLHTTTPVQPSSYIPWAPPNASQLFGLASRVMESYRVDIVLGWYFEPYGIVAAQIAKMYGVPFALRHAGSDIGRLALNPDLAAAYARMARDCAALFTGSPSHPVREILSSLEFPAERCIRLRAGALPTAYTRNAKPLDIPKLVEGLPDWYGGVVRDPDLATLASSLATDTPDPAWPTVAMYGKVGRTKGSYDLLRTLDRLASSGASFNYLTIAAGRQNELRRYFQAITNSPQLRRRSCVLPPLPPWQVPSFLRSCDVVCFLERDFPIAFHHSFVPREVLATGRCLVCSAEMARKLPFSRNLVDGKNLVVIEDPTDDEEMYAKLRVVLVNAAHRRAIAHHGQYLADFWEGELRPSRGFAGQIEDLAASFN